MPPGAAPSSFPIDVRGIERLEYGVIPRRSLARPALQLGSNALPAIVPCVRPGWNFVVGTEYPAVVRPGVEGLWILRISHQRREYSAFGPYARYTGIGPKSRGDHSEDSEDASVTSSISASF
jgi:hypothetical protein